ncbi:MAG: hypothetical protein K0S01_1021 [Herbinix sp.]|jgi:hypothetical protein|nr:hypothetical protein [Herbinix sp.]
MMTLQYVIAGGHLQINKQVFAGELLLPDSSLKKILRADEVKGSKQPKITRAEQMVRIDYNDASDITLDEGFYDLFKKLKLKYKEKIKGRIVIRITALTSYYVILNMEMEDERVLYE